MKKGWWKLDKILPTGDLAFKKVLSSEENKDILRACSKIPKHAFWASFLSFWARSPVGVAPLRLLPAHPNCRKICSRLHISPFPNRPLRPDPRLLLFWCSGRRSDYWASLQYCRVPRVHRRERNPSLAPHGQRHRSHDQSAKGCLRISLKGRLHFRNANQENKVLCRKIFAISFWAFLSKL